MHCFMSFSHPQFLITVKTNTMKKLHLLTFTCFPLLIFCFIGFGQTPDWTAKYNNAGPGKVMSTDAAGNIYVSGPGDGGTKSGGIDFITIKYKPDGSQDWAMKYNGPNSGEDYPYAIAVDAGGNVYVTGRSFVSNAPKGLLNFDYATVKYSPTGALLWARRFGSPGNRNDVPQDVKVDNAGNVFVTGYADANVVLGGGNSIVTVKYNSAGDAKWTATYDMLPNSYETSANQEEAYSLALDGNGNVYLTGQSGGSILVKYNDLGTSANLEWIRNAGDQSLRKVLVDGDDNIIVTGWGATTMKYNSAGDILWQSNYAGGPSIADPSFWDMALDATGSVYVTGISSNGTNNDYITVKYNSNGIEQWATRFNGIDNDRDHARAIAVDGNGHAYVTGFTSVKSGRNFIYAYGTVKYNSSTGSEVWRKIYNGSDNLGATAFDIAVDLSGNLFVTGGSTTKSSGNITTIQYSAGRSASRSVTTAPAVEALQNNFSLKNYPNPFSQSTTIEYQLPVEGKVKLSVFDLSGHEITTLVNENKQAGTHFVNFNAAKLSGGMYLYRIQAEEFVETKKLVVIK